MSVSIEQETYELAKKKGCPFRPVQSNLQKWLREKHNIHIIIRPGFGSEIWYDWIVVTEQQEILADRDTSFETYELALEAALVEGLKLLPDAT
jgi:hypothetical protein